MSRLLLSLAGVVLLAVVALAVIWLAGQLLVGIGVLALGTAGVLLRLLWFLIVAAGLGGVVYFVANAWRPTHQIAGSRPVSLAEPVTRVADLRVNVPAAVKGAATEANHEQQ